MNFETENIVYQEITKPLASLEEVLAYQNETVVYEMMDQYDIPFDEAEEIFTETKKWLWICANWHRDYLEGKEIPDLIVTYDLLIIDEMWHTFMLYSFDYTNFCNNFFGYYLHHQPTPPPFNKIKKMDRPQGTPGSPFSTSDEIENRITKEQLEGVLNYIYDLVGGDTINLWYDVYPDKYGIDFFQKKYVKWE